ncbi:hypothetical protein FBU30_001275 [Linnemannia zychae]|nr:hypothetical protein FBU30_001275 [Linnemannia zychae]
MKIIALATVFIATVATALPANNTITLEKRACRSSTLSWEVYPGRYEGDVKNIFRLTIRDYYQGSVEKYGRPDEAVEPCNNVFCARVDGMFWNDKLKLTYKGQVRQYSKRSANGPTPSGSYGPSYDYYDCLEG